MTLPKLIVLGNVNLDLGVGPIPVWPRPGTEVMGERAVYRPGGSAGNAALAAAAAGVPVELHADVGGDALGGWLLKALEGAGIDCAHVRRRVEARTAFSFGALHPDGERTFFSFPGHLATQAVGERGGICAAPPGSVVLACGYYLLPQWRNGALTELFAACRARGLVTAVDTGWPPDGRFEWDELKALLNETDLFLPNTAEASAIAGFMGGDKLEARDGTGPADPEIGLQHVLLRLADCVRTPVIKDGPRGAWGLSEGRAIHRAADPVAPEDTIGAGDTFNAVLIQALLLEGRPMGSALDYANTAARLAITSRDPARRYPTAAEIEAEVDRRGMWAGA